MAPTAPERCEVIPGTKGTCHNCGDPIIYHTFDQGWRSNVWIHVREPEVLAEAEEKRRPSLVIACKPGESGQSVSIADPAHLCWADQQGSGVRCEKKPTEDWAREGIKACGIHGKIEFADRERVALARKRQEENEERRELEKWARQSALKAFKDEFRSWGLSLGDEGDVTIIGDDSEQSFAMSIPSTMRPESLGRMHGYISYNFMKRWMEVRSREEGGSQPEG